MRDAMTRVMERDAARALVVKTTAEAIKEGAGAGFVKKSAQYALKKATTEEVAKTLGRTIVKVGSKGTPLFIGVDMAEILIERSGNARVAKATSLAGYLAVGGALGGPSGALVAAGLWGVGQLISVIWR